MKVTKSLYDVLLSVFGNRDIEGIPREQILDDCLVREREYASTASLKRVITTNINAIVSSCKGFKIGKTGDPGNRANAYRQYSRMYLLCKGRKGSIDVLESYYIHKYIGRAKCDNAKEGSAGSMTNSHHCYYLYVVVR